MYTLIYYDESNATNVHCTNSSDRPYYIENVHHEHNFYYMKSSGDNDEEQEGDDAMDEDNKDSDE